MPIINFKQIDGTEDEVEIATGYSIMEGGTMNNIAGLAVSYTHLRAHET